MKKLFIGKRRIAVVGAIVAFIAVSASAAFAYFTSTGSGTGSASVGTASGGWAVTVKSDTTGTLLPGSGNEKIGYTITNSGKGAQAFSTVAATVNADSSGNVVDATTKNPVVGCLASYFTADAGVTTPAAGTSIAKNGTATGTVTVTMTDSGTNQDACEGVSPEITVTVDPTASS